ncbi:MAG: formyltetrahydrofolate deformylase [Oligoflexia bacterium]|nr:formyltetrahydrofolate deformylase [Oligoflexia bacterium]
MQCPDKTGIIAKVAGFIHGLGANIIKSDQHSTVDDDPWFFMRFEFSFDPSLIKGGDIERKFSVLAKDLNAEWEIHYRSRRMRMGLLVSKENHCLVDLLYRWKNGEITVDIPFVISNHDVHSGLVKNLGADFFYVPAEQSGREKIEKQLLEIVKDKTDFLVLARYMQILSENFLSAYRNDIINIHHSFLPSFKGASPYRQAYNRGVKLIGATAHYVSAEIDEGPIISQMVERAGTKDSIEDLKKKGRNIEKITLANAVELHIEHKIIKYKNKTVVFE